MAQFALWAISGLLCFYLQAKSVRFESFWAFIVCGVIAPFSIIAFGVYASRGLL